MDLAQCAFIYVRENSAFCPRFLRTGASVISARDLVIHRMDDPGLNRILLL